MGQLPTAHDVWHDVEAIRERAPLVHNITNYVVMNTTANALLAVGASPVMAHAVEEVADMVAIASVLVINVGTLSPRWVDAMGLAMRAARKHDVPIAVDPVGAGATPYRTQTVHDLISDVPPAVIRGNASEIRALVASGASTKGVDSVDESTSALEAAAQLHERYGAVVAVTGATDFVVGEGRTVRVENGHPLMGRVTGLGCTATALCGAFLAINPSPGRAVVHALAVSSIAGELAAERADGPGTLQVHLLDSLYGLTRAQIADRLRVAVDQ